MPGRAAYRFEYTVSGNAVMATKVTDPRGHVTHWRFNGLGDWVRQEDALGRVRTRRLDPATNLALAPNGDIYVSDGYGNARIHRFSNDGRLVTSWGEPGENNGEFRNVHSVWQHRGRVYVADRQNNRLQVFTPDGKHLETWPGYLQPTKIFVDQNDVMYVAELGARVTINDLKGNVLARWGGERSHDPGLFWGPHGVWTDSKGDLYVCEVLDGARVQKFTRRR